MHHYMKVGPHFFISCFTPCILQNPKNDREFQKVPGSDNMKADKAGLYSLVFMNKNKERRPFIDGFEVKSFD